MLRSLKNIGTKLRFEWKSLNEKEKIIEKAKELVDNEDFEEAIKILEDFIRNQSDNNVKNCLIDALFAYGGYLNDDYVLEYEKSIAYFKRIIELDPKNYRAHYNLGIAYFNLNLFEEALDSYNTSISLKPDYKHGYYNIGLLHEATENLEDAIRAYEKALEIDPKFVYAIHALKAIKMDMGNHMETPVNTIEVNNTIEQLKTLLGMSKRVRFDMIQEILNVSKKTLLRIIIKWGEKKYCEIDGDYLIINKESLDQFIKEIDQKDL